jgi:N-acetylated-alpha-linked acidic dipeptidase
MQGDLPLPYKFGPGPVKVKIRTEMKNQDGPMRDVISKIDGEKFPDQWIIVGNHHDAWIYGAGDPSSGTASLLEFARALGALIKQGYKPQRTLILAFWDAEENMLGGSTEWLEDHKEQLLKNAVACINMDSSVFNIDRPLSVNAHPALHALFREVTQSIPDPKSGKTMYEVWLAQQNQYRTTPSVDGWGEFFNPSAELKEPFVFSSPSDDAAPFFNQLALPASDMYYGADYGMYHSIYENFHWMKTVVDPKFEYHIAMAKLQGFAALRLANADFIPLDFAGEARYWKKALATLKAPRIQEFKTLPDQWEKEANLLAAAEAEFLKRHRLTNEQSAELNRQIFLITRDFYRADGRPGFTLERNLWSGSDGSLPALRAAAERNDSKAVQSETEIYQRALQQRVTHLRELRKAMK